jgi:hypothetical protein
MNSYGSKMQNADSQGNIHNDVRTNEELKQFIRSKYRTIIGHFDGYHVHLQTALTQNLPLSYPGLYY